MIARFADDESANPNTNTSPPSCGRRHPGSRPGPGPHPSLLPITTHSKREENAHWRWWSFSSLLCNVSYDRCEVALSYAPLPPQCSPCAPSAVTVNRHGDLVWSRGETRDQSTAENRGRLPSVILHFCTSSASSREDIDSCGGRQHTHKKVQAIGPFCFTPSLLSPAASFCSAAESRRLFRASVQDLPSVAPPPA